MAGAPPGSSVHGEHPKFVVRLNENRESRNELVKFSPLRTSAIGQRWADLLISEHIAHGVLGHVGISVVNSQLFELGDRVYLETERFDRVGADGRRGAISLLALDNSRYERLDTWTAAAERLVAERLLGEEDTERIRLLDAFGALTANTDRHFGNITLFDRYEGPFVLAAVYDMLPMLFAPQNEQLVERTFEPPPPTAAALSAWSSALRSAETYWDALASETRISQEFREISRRSLEALRDAPRRGVR
jgi:hypothetical protein